MIEPILLDKTGKEILQALNVIKAGTQYVKGEKGDAGKNYVITENDYNAIAEVTKPKVITEINPTLEDISGVAENAVEIAKGANQSIAFDSYQTMITAFNELQGTEYKKGQNVYIVTLGVPDLWISDVEEISEEYTYISDEDFITSLKAGGVQVGHYVFAMLETQKVDLTDYVKNTDYATQNKGGVIKINNTYAFNIAEDGTISIISLDSATYNSKSSYTAISKGTLENIKNSNIKEGLVNNEIQLTDEEKLAIETWLGLSETYLTTYNATPYTVTGDYNPAHKKYVDEKIVSLTQEEYDKIASPNPTTLYIIKEA